MPPATSPVDLTMCTHEETSGFFKNVLVALGLSGGAAAAGKSDGTHHGVIAVDPHRNAILSYPTRLGF